MYKFIFDHNNPIIKKFNVFLHINFEKETKSLGEVDNIDKSIIYILKAGNETLIEDLTYISSIINAQPQLSTTQSLHTFQVYLTNYSGTVTIEGSIDEQGASPKNWQTIQTLTLLNSTSNAYRNIVGKYTWFRIKHIPTLGTLGTVDKILYR